MNNFLKDFVWLTVFMVVFFALHILVINVFFNWNPIPSPLYFGYGLLYLLTLGLFGLVRLAQGWDVNKAGFAFLLGSGIKMLVSLMYVFLLITNQVDQYYYLILHFMVPYFLVLIFEVFYMMRMLKSLF
jgi:hypothetical protein